jgi:hypothetical protein
MRFRGFRAATADIRGLRSCVIVSGLHRSGTSAVTRLVNLLGADITHDLLPADRNNSRGYWESHAVVAIHDRLLQTVTASQDHAFDPTPLPIDWLATDAAREAKRHLTSIIQREFADSRFFVVKDPRIWRLLPLWVELLHDLGIAPIVVIPFRNPLEVAASLAQRDRIPLPKVLFLYFCTYLETELASRAIPRVFVRYDHLLQDWHPFARCLGQISRAGVSPPSKSVAIEIERFITTDLYHHRFNREQMLRQSEIPAAIIDVFDRMGEAETGDESKLRSSFDLFRANAGAAAHLYHGFLISELQYLRQQLMREIRIRKSFETSTCWRVTAPLRWLKLQVLSKLASSPNGPKPGSQIEAAAEAASIPKRPLIAAADELGVRTQHGQWWLPG